MSTDHVVDVSRGELVELLVVAEDDDGNIDGAQDGQLMRFLEQTTFAFEKRAIITWSAVDHHQPASPLAGLDSTYTERFLSSLMALISIFRLPILTAAVWVELRQDARPGLIPASARHPASLVTSRLPDV
jgi:hypothetical protein